LRICVYWDYLLLNRVEKYKTVQKEKMDTNTAPSQRFDPYAHGLSSGHSDIFTPWLGPASRPAETSPYEKKNSSKYDLPEARVGESIYLRDTVEDWMLTANQTWYTERIMPWYRTDQLHVQWTEWENNAHFMGTTPHQAMSQVVTSKRTIRKASMIRRGIAAEFEDDFVRTSLGRSRFVASLAQIARSVQETANVEILRALLGCHRYQQVYIRKHGIISEGDLDGYLDRQADRFMIAQKERFGLESLNTEIDKEQEMYQANANVWILGREVMDYCSTVRPEKTLYHLGGQEAVDRINGRGGGRQASGGTMGNVDSLEPTRMISDTPVYLAKSYVVDSVGGADLLSRSVEKGVYNTMVDRTRDYKLYKTSSRSILVYDNDVDDWAEISLQEAINKCVLWGSDDNVFDPFSGGNIRGRQIASDVSIEGQNDFLRYGGWDSTIKATKQDVKYIGDLDLEWMTTSQCLAAGQTVLNALQRQNKNVTTKNIVDLAKDILGKDNVLLSKDSNNVILENMKDYKVVKIVDPPLDLSDPDSIASSIPGAETKHTHFLETTLGAVLPESHKASLQAIAGDTSVNWEVRAEKVKNLVESTYDADPSSYADSFDDRERIQSWYQNRFNSYATNFAQWAQKQPGAASKNVQGQIQSIPIGEPLPAGYSYLNATEEAKAQRMTVKTVPTSLRDFGHAHFFEASAQIGSGMARRRMAGVRIGAGVEKEMAKHRGRGEKKNDEFEKARLDVRFVNLEKRINTIAASSASDLVKLAAILFLGSRFNKQVFMAFADADIYVPAGFLLLRPHATYRTRYGIKCADNGRTGYTFFGNSNMQIAHEAARKVGLMHYTAYLSAVVMYPKNVYIVQDLFCEKYLGGMGVAFWSRETYHQKGANRRKKSIICTMLPPNFGERQGKLDSKIDIRGQWYTHHTMKLVDQERFNQSCYPGGGRTAAAMGWWDPLRKSKAIDHAARSRKIDINFTCHQGVQFHFNIKTETWGDVITEKGAFGPKVYPGCGQVRDGKMRYLETPGYLTNGRLA